LLLNVPGFTIGTSGMRLTVDDCPIGLVAGNSTSSLFSRKGITYKDLSLAVSIPSSDLGVDYFVTDSNRLVPSDHLGDFETFSTIGKYAYSFSLSSLILQSLALILLVVFRVPPSLLFSSRPLLSSLTDRDHFIGNIILSLLSLSTVSLFLYFGLMSSFTSPLLGRIINYSIDRCVDSPFVGPVDEMGRLEQMQFIGEYIRDYSAPDGVSFYTFSVSIGLNYLFLICLFYLNINTKRIVSRLPPSQLKLLPWYSRIFPMYWSMILLLVGVTANAFVQYSARVRGYPLNKYYWETTLTSASGGEAKFRIGSLLDVILDNLHTFIVSPSMTTITIGFWLPLILSVSLSSISLILSLSKSLETISVLLIFRAVVAVTTVSPTPASVLQHPQCYSSPPALSLASLFSPSESCNDLMFSMYSIFIFVPFMLVWFSIKFTPSFDRKLFAYSVLSICGLVSAIIVVVCRLQYTSDVYIGSVVTILYCLSQSPSYRLLLTFGLERTSSGKDRIPLSEKILPQLDEIIRRIELYRMSSEGSDALKMDEGEFRQIVENFDLLNEIINECQSNELVEGVPVEDDLENKEK
jgi:hypothetical protein